MKLGKYLNKTSVNGEILHVQKNVCTEETLHRDNRMFHSSRTVRRNLELITNILICKCVSDFISSTMTY
jgi:hypothetical protein